MNSREQILRKLRGQSVPPVPLPSEAVRCTEYADLREQFRQMVESVGGTFHQVPNRAAIAAQWQAHPAYAAAQRVISRLPEIVGNVDLDAIADPHELASVDWALIPAELGVAENGALWLTDRALRQRVVLFIVQHLVLVVRNVDLVQHLPQAYERIRLGESSLGIFISGPSKTADIEQTLVLGAHGPRSLTVFCVDDPA